MFSDDQWLIAFLRGCKFSLEQTKKKIDLFYTMKTLLPEFFSNRDPFLPEIQELLKRGTFIILPKTVDPAGPRIAFIRIQEMDPENVSVITGLKVLTMIVDIMLMEDDNYVVAGGCGLGDAKALSYKYMAQITPDLIRKVAICGQDAYATRIKGLYSVNTPSFIMTLYHAFKMLVKEKIRNRICFYDEGNLKDLYAQVPRSVLPNEYGGEAGSYIEIAAHWKQKVESYRDWFLEDSQYGTDETKRPGKPETSEKLFGVEGSFRKLEVD